MSGVLGCVLAIRDRPPAVLERTMQTYAFQTLQPGDKVLLDYGSAAEFAGAYQRICQQFGWRLVRREPPVPRWSLSDAYNHAVAALDLRVDTVFKSDIDVLLGQDVLETASILGRQRLCVFSCLSTCAAHAYPARLTGQRELIDLLNSHEPLEPMPSEGMHAYPRRWFEEIGGFDVAFTGWGFEDSDLRERAKRSIGVVYVTTSLLIHQWHPPSHRPEDAVRNEAHYRKMKQQEGMVYRNGRGPSSRTVQPSIQADPPITVAEAVVDRSGRGAPMRIAIATRSCNDVLYHASGELLRLEAASSEAPVQWQRYRLTGTDSLGYFRDLLRLDADWVINIDEDAFVLHPHRLLGLVRHMAAHGFSACGMPDGGVVEIRRHHPAACNAFFNVFDLRKVRPIWQDWQRILAAKPRPEYEKTIPDFARRSVCALDHFERYYGVFFTLLDAEERILYLDAEEWEDGISTLLKDHNGKPLLLHCWYSRHWESSYHTRQRYRDAIAYARRVQGLSPSESKEPVA